MYLTIFSDVAELEASCLLPNHVICPFKLLRSNSMNSLHIELLDSVPSLGFQVVENLVSVPQMAVYPWYLLCIYICVPVYHVQPPCAWSDLGTSTGPRWSTVHLFVHRGFGLNFSNPEPLTLSTVLLWPQWLGSSQGTQKREYVKRQDTFAVCIRIRKNALLHIVTTHILFRFHHIPPHSTDHQYHQLIPPPGHNCSSKINEIRLD